MSSSGDRAAAKYSASAPWPIATNLKRAHGGCLRRFRTPSGSTVSKFHPIPAWAWRVFPPTAPMRPPLSGGRLWRVSRAIADPLEPVAHSEPSTDAATARRHSLADDMRGALHRGEFELYYQPQVFIDQREVIGHEALLRWKHPTLGMVSPAEFIPIAEQTGLIVDIGDWTLRTACVTAAQWPAHWRVAVNLSPLQLRQTNLAERVEQAFVAKADWRRSGLNSN